MREFLIVKTCLIILFVFFLNKGKALDDETKEFTNKHDHLSFSKKKKEIELKLNENKETKLLESVVQKFSNPKKNNEEILIKIIDLQQKEIRKLYERIYYLEKKLDECCKNDNFSEEISFENRKKYFTENIAENENDDLSKNRMLVPISPKLNVENSDLECSLNSINDGETKRKKWEPNENSIEINGNSIGLKLQKKIERDRENKYILFNIEGEITNIINFKIPELTMKIKGNESN